MERKFSNLCPYHMFTIMWVQMKMQIRMWMQKLIKIIMWMWDNEVYWGEEEHKHKKLENAKIIW